MPAKSNSTSFKKGRQATNKSGRFKNCEICSNSFWVTKSAEKTRPCRTCSKKCSDELLRRKNLGQSRRQKHLELAQQGLTLKEISVITNSPIGTVASDLNQLKYRKRTKAGESYSAKVKQLRKIYKCCEICNFDRIVEVAHIIPASNGGDLSEDNTVGLCPNHHYLFDSDKLTEEEYNKIKQKVERSRARSFKTAV